MVCVLVHHSLHQLQGVQQRPGGKHVLRTVIGLRRAMWGEGGGLAIRFVRGETGSKLFPERKIQITFANITTSAKNARDTKLSIDFRGGTPGRAPGPCRLGRSWTGPWPPAPWQTAAASGPGKKRKIRHTIQKKSTAF